MGLEVGVSGRTRILVTGADGFVGRALCPMLRDAGFDVVEGTRALYGEIGPDTDWQTAFSGGIEAIVHLAGIAHVPHGDVDGGYYRRVNVLGSMSLAEAAIRAGCKRLVFLSSATVMGSESTDIEWDETMTPAPGNAYAESKLEAERRLAETCAGRMELVVLRPPLIYGPGVKANFRKLAWLAAGVWPLPLRSVRNRRRLLGIDNLGAAVELALRHPAAAGRIFFAGDAEETSTPALLRQLAAARGRRVWLLPFPPSWLARLSAIVAPSIGRRLLGNFRFSDVAFRSACGWAPPMSLAEGIRRMSQETAGKRSR